MVRRRRRRRCCQLVKKVMLCVQATSSLDQIKAMTKKNIYRSDYNMFIYK